MMDTERLVRMANQIAAALRSYPRSEAVEGTANHIVTFWEPRMRAALRAHLDAGGEGLSDLALAAARHLEAAKRQPAASEETLVTAEDRAPARNVEGNPIPAGKDGRRA